MEISVTSNLFDTVDGVFPAQKRNSVNSQATLIRAGIEALQKKRFDEIAIPDLAKSCGVSVGAFYARFRDKDAYFRALQAQTIYESDLLTHQALIETDLSTLTPKAVIKQVISLLLSIFNSPFRGVLRESFMRSQGSFDYWVDMRASGQQVQRALVESLKHRLPEQSVAQAETRLKFVYQTIVGILLNDLVNSFHVFKACDQALSAELSLMLEGYLGLH